MTNQAQRQATILPDLTQPVVTVDVDAELAALRAENEALKAKALAQSVIRCKVSEKGALSIYGMGRFPFTFYLSQWKAFRANLGAIDAFVATNMAKFATAKPAKE